MQTITISDTPEQRIKTASLPVDIGDDGNPVMGEGAWAKQFLFNIVDSGLDKAERTQNRNARVRKTMNEADFIID